MERCTDTRSDSRNANRDRCQWLGLGRSSPQFQCYKSSGQSSKWTLARMHKQQTVKLSGIVCNSVNFGVNERLCQRQAHSDSIRQYNSSCVSQSPGRFESRSVRVSSISVGNMLQYGDNNDSEILRRQVEHSRGLSEQNLQQLRMATPSQSVQVHRQVVRATHSGPVRINHECAVAALQQQIRGSRIGGSGCHSPKQLGLREQFRELSVQDDPKSAKGNSEAGGDCYSDSTTVAGATLVQNAGTNDCSKSPKVASVSQDLHSSVFKVSGATKKQELENVCLESQWQKRLSEKKWSKQAIQFHSLSLAKSTRLQYDAIIVKFQSFCGLEPCEPPPKQCCVVANFLSKVASESDRPKSKINVTVAVLSHFYQLFDMYNVMDSSDIRRLVIGITKGGTQCPRVLTPAMPIEPFKIMFQHWSDNDQLTVTQLRLKCITLLALVCMLRPSDIAPRGVFFYSSEQSTKDVVFSLDNVNFQDNGSVDIVIHGNKNDYHRDGFHINIPQASDPKLDPVSALKHYINKTEHCRSLTMQAVFVSLNKKQGMYQGLKSSGVRAVLNEAIKRAGLDCKLYTSKCFRVTGATTGVRAGQDPNIVRSLGRWKSCSVFEEHYVHNIPPRVYTDNILNFKD